MQKVLNTIRIALPLCLLGSTGVVHAMSGEEAARPDVQSALPAASKADQGTTPADRQEVVAGFGKAVDDSGLDEVRGGFELGDGLLASLGIQQVAYIDGNLVTSTSINIPDIGQITPQQALALSAALGNLNLVIQNGPGNSIDPSSTVQGNNVAATLGQGPSGNAVTSSSMGQGGAAAVPIQGASGNAGASASTANAASTNAGASSSTAAALLGQGNGLATVIQNSLSNQSIRTLTTLNISVNTLQVMHDLNLQSTLQAAQQLSLSLGH